MDEFFADLFDGDDDIFWLNYEALPVNKSAFVPYANRPMIQFGQENAGNGSKSLNANKKMIQFLRRIRSAKMGYPGHDREPGHRHVISERMRRKREKQNYLALHSMWPRGTKNDKDTIIETAAKRIQELQRCKQELEMENYDLKNIEIV